MFLLPLFAAALAIAPADRLAMADRLFNRARYAEAQAEYAAIRNEAGLAADEIAYRLAECDRALGKTAEARKAYDEFLRLHPTSRHADRVRLQRALTAESAAQKISDLKLLDTDRVDKKLRASALYHLGVAASDTNALIRSRALDPKGPCAVHATLRLAAIFAKSPNPADHRRAVDGYLEIAFGKNMPAGFPEEALYLGASVCYADRRYRESVTFLRRYLKDYPNGRHAVDARVACAWCEYLSGRPADAIALASGITRDDTTYLVAAATHATGDDEKARELFTKYIADYPNGRYRKDAELPLARIEFERARKAGDEKAMALAARRAASLSATAADRLRLAWTLERANDADAALREYATITRDYPGTPEAAEATYRKAMVDLRASRWSAAELALKEALAGKLDASRRAEAHYWRGVAAVKLGHVAEGTESLKQALAAGLELDQSREARLILADLDFNAGRTDVAKAEYAKLIQEGAAERMSAAKILAVGKLLSGEEARTCAKMLTASKAAEWRQAGWALLGQLDEADGSFAAAIADYRNCLAEKCVTEPVPAVAAALGALEAQGEDPAAEATLKKAIDLNAKDPAARAVCYLHLAEIMIAKNNVHDARAYATVVVTLFENTPSAKAAEELLKNHPEEAK